MAKRRYVRSVPGTRYMSCRMGQLCVADIREVLPGDYINYRCRIGVHLSPLQAPELSPLIVRQDQFFVANRINWNYWDNYISQKLLEDSTVGPFNENQLIPPHVYFGFGSGLYAQDTSNSSYGHIDNVRGVYDLLEQLGARFSYTDTSKLSGNQSVTGSLFGASAFPLMGYWRIWHEYYRDAYLQNDEFVAGEANNQRIPLLGDPWADEKPLSDDTSMSQLYMSWQSPLQSLPAFANYTGTYGRKLPGYTLSLGTTVSSEFPTIDPHRTTRGIFTFYKRQPASAVGILGKDEQNPGIILPGCAVYIPLDLGVKVTGVEGVQEPVGSLGMCAPVCMPKDYIFASRQSPVYNQGPATPEDLLSVRKGFQVLGYKEKVLRFDNRIQSWLRNMFHVRVSDKRCQVPLWLHSSQSVINTQEVLGTVNNTDTVLGQLGGFGIGAVRGKKVKFRAEEHGFLYTLFYINPVPIYGDGVRRYWWRGQVSNQTGLPSFDGSLDWPLPDFARIGQQSWFAGELSFITQPQSGSGVLGFWQPGGYTDRYSELAFSNMDVCGDFRTTLDFWHTGLFFGRGNTPAKVGELPGFKGVSGDFVSMYRRTLNNMRGLGSANTISEALSARLFDAANSADQFWCVVSTDYWCSSRVPAHPHPGYADHTSKVI